MKKYLFLIMLILSSMTGYTQFDWSSSDWKEKSLGLGCSRSAIMTQPVMKIMEAFLNKDLDKIRKTLYSELSADQFLAVFFLEQLSHEKELSLNQQELERIVAIKRSSQLVPICLGCTYWDEQPLNNLLDINNKHRVYEAAEALFKKYYKTLNP